MKQYVNTLTEGSVVDSIFAVRSKEVRAARTGETYLALELADRTGRMPAVMFRPEADALAMPAGVVARARGRVTTFRGTRRVSLDALAPAKRWDGEDLIAAGPHDPEEMLGRLRALVGSVKDPALRGVLNAVFGDKEFMRRFRACPASQAHHHAHVGGLLAHTVAVATLCRTLADAYAPLDDDLLVAAALLHDVGKVEELAFETAVEYTDAGRLVGHVVLGDRRIRDAIARAGVRVPAPVLLRLSHLVLSHHGELEWGAPKRPCTLEALVLHHADNLDAKITGFVETVVGAASVDEAWTDSFNLFRRPLYAPRAAEDDREHPPAEDAQYARVGAA